MIDFVFVQDHQVICFIWWFFVFRGEVLGCFLPQRCAKVFAEFREGLFLGFVV